MEIECEERPLLTPKKHDDVFEISRSQPRDISDDNSEIIRKNTHTEGRETAIHDDRDSRRSKEISKRTNKRKCPKIKKCQRECTKCGRKSETKGFIKKRSQKTKILRERCRENNDTNNRKKGELKTNIVDKREWVQESQESSDKKRKHQCSNPISPETRTVSEYTHKRSTPHRSIASHQQGKRKYHARNDDNTSPRK